MVSIVTICNCCSKWEDVSWNNKWGAQEVARLTFTSDSGTWHLGHAANKILRMKNGLQQRTNVKKTSPKTYSCPTMDRQSEKEKIELCSLVRNILDSLPRHTNKQAVCVINLPWLLSARWPQRLPIDSSSSAGLKSSIWNSVMVSAHY